MNISRRTALQASVATITGLALPQVQASPELHLESYPNYLLVTHEEVNGLSLGFSENDKQDRFVDLFTKTQDSLWWFSEEGPFENDLNICMTCPVHYTPFFNLKGLGKCLIPKSKSTLVHFVYQNELYKTKFNFKYHDENYFPAYYAKLVKGLEIKHFLNIHYDILDVSPLVSNQYKYKVKDRSGKIVTGVEHTMSIESAESKIAMNYRRPQFLSLEQV